MKSIHNNKGFTLIELLVVSGILVAISGIIGGILYSTLRGSDVTRTKTVVSQNGNYAMTSMSEIIKRSKAILGVYPGPPPTTPEDPFVDCTGSPEGTHLSLLMPDNKEVLLTCDAQDPAHTIASSSAENTYNLTDESLVTNACSIKCFQSSPFSTPRIELKFELGKDDGSGNIQTNTGELFQTQINVRNYNNQ